ncbi:hypothetical protein JVT61DRAFT_2241 [Boletus reticuloceps]|uniref:EH domain-containing protein n=1 Tax=Boletus reticuloceps TaxID=495285 RepID=A0A8I3ABE9_9AGAM|nr:hypothetical protein JVT61DRAFT_2241 [Boletus reticuloceps]
MPSASLQSRIQAFEALSSSSSQRMSTTAPSLANTNSSNLLESPISPTASLLHPISPFVAPASSNKSRSPSPSLVSQTSLIDLKDWIVEDGPVEPPSALRHTRTVGIGRLNGIRESSRTPSPSSNKPTPTYGASNSSTTLISFESPPKPHPPLPPRSNAVDRVSTQRSVSAGSETGATLRPPGRSDSLTIEHTYPPGAHKFGAGRVGHASASSISSFHSVSLSSDGSNVEVHGPKISNKPPSFTFEADSTTADVDTASIAESFENVSASSATSPSTAIPFDWEQGITKAKTSPKHETPFLPRPATKVVPVVPPKPLARSISASSSSTATSAKTRRPPPPPPPYQPRTRPSSSRASVVSTSASTSDRSSILSNVTTTSRTSISTRNSAQSGGSVKSSPLLRPTPVPLAAQSRYESLFDSAVRGRRKAEKKVQKTKLLSPPPLSAKKGRQAAGWRSLSVDLTTTPEDHPVLSSEKGLEDKEEEESFSVAPEEKLNGRIVKHVWSASRLDRQKLRNIWNDCDPQCTGFVDRDAFVRGMWRIDEELRRAQLARRTSALTAASSQRIPHRPLLPPRPQSATRLLI